MGLSGFYGLKTWKLLGLTNQEAGCYLLWNADAWVIVSEVKPSGIVQHLFWDSGRDFPNQIVSSSVWLGFRPEKQT